MGQIRNENLLRQFEAVDSFIESRYADWCLLRRHLHANPELSWEEAETTEFIQRHLSAIGLQMTPGPRGRGGFVDLFPTAGNAGATGGMIAIRGDIDAIPVHEETDLEFCSKNEGVMHACGHDVHATVVLAVCETLKHISSELSSPPNVRAIFQPAEEVAQGATEMIAIGALEGVQRIIAMHVDSSREVGTFGFRDGVQTACCDEIQITFAGSGGHGARPHETADPILAAAQFINAAYATVPRVTDARRSIVLSFCQIAGGKSANVIPTDVSIKGTLRSFDHETRNRVFQQLETLAETIGRPLGVEVKFVPGVSIPSVINCADTNRLLRSAAESIVGPEAIGDVEPSLGGEDFACYQALLPGSLVRVGSANGDRGTAHLHSPLFDVDERVICYATRLFVRTILHWTHQDQKA